MIHKLDFNRVSNVKRDGNKFVFQYMPKDSRKPVSMTVESSLSGLTVWLEVTMDGERVFGAIMNESHKDFSEIHLAFLKLHVRWDFPNRRKQEEKRLAVDQFCKDEGLTE